MAAFDSNPSLHGQLVHGRDVHPMTEIERIVREQDIRVAVIAVPADASQGVCERLVKAGVRGVLNFAPKRLTVPPGVSIVSVDLATQLEQLAFQVSLPYEG